MRIHGYTVLIFCLVVLACSDDSTTNKGGSDQGVGDGPTIQVDRATLEGPPAAAPKVNFSAPLAGQTVKGQVTVTVDVKPSTGISEVKIDVDGVSLATISTAPWTATWDTTSSMDGTYYLKATARDGVGQTGSSTIKVRVSNPGSTGDAKPSVKVIYPVDGSEVCGKLSLEAAASDDVGIDKVEFFVDGTKIGSTKVSPYQVNWDTSGVTDGLHMIKAVAYDSKGQAAADKSNVKVTNSGKCDNIPSVKFTSPAATVKAVKGTISLKAAASDDVGVVKVQFFVDNAMVSEKKTIPYEATWDTSTAKEGAHTLKALAYDTAGQTGKDVMQLFVDRTAPTVQITAPYDGSTIKNGDAVTVAATDNIALDKVSILVNGTSVATFTKSPYSHKWTSTGTNCGKNDITAKACDLSGSCVTTSNPTQVTYIIGTSQHCAIAGKCIGSGTVNPNNSCQMCEPWTSSSAWTNDNNKSCDDNTLCTHTDQCQGGKCAGTAYTCDDKLSCTADVCTGKAPAPAGCTFTLKAGHCLIANKCYSSGTKNPSDPCEKCNPLKSTSKWSEGPGCSCKGMLGKACTKTGQECGSKGTCLLNSADGKSGFCTCTCTPDNTSTPLINEDTCPDATTTKWSMCGKVSMSGAAAKNLCLRTCTPTLGKNDCPGNTYCHPRSGPAAGIYTNAVCLYTGGCTKDADCPLTTGTHCDTATTPSGCPATETCKKLYSSSTKGMCTIAGKCDVKSQLCDKHSKGKATAKVGDPCKSDLECGGNMNCWLELDESAYLGKAGAACKANWDCCSYSCKNGTCATGAPCRTINRNGYCYIPSCQWSKTMNSFACDTGSVCSIMWTGGICFKSCDLKSKSDCRGLASAGGAKVDYLGDYECRAWNNLQIGGSLVASKPVCEPAHNMACDMFGASSLDCTSVGLQSNPTKMSCRDPKTNLTLTNKADPKGLCLDDTASGAVAP